MSPGSSLCFTNSIAARTSRATQNTKVRPKGLTGWLRPNTNRVWDAYQNNGGSKLSEIRTPPWLGHLDG
jgi:hypothetical protein